MRRYIEHKRSAMDFTRRCVSLILTESGRERSFNFIKRRLNECLVTFTNQRRDVM